MQRRRADAIVVDFSSRVDTADKTAATTTFTTDIKDTTAALSINIGGTAALPTAIDAPATHDIVAVTVSKSDTRVAVVSSATLLLATFMHGSRRCPKLDARYMQCTPSSVYRNSDICFCSYVKMIFQEK